MSALPQTVRRWAAQLFCFWLLLTTRLWQAAGGSIFGPSTILARRAGRLGLERRPPYSARGGEQFMNRNAIDELKQRVALLEYLQTHGWKAARSIRGGRFMGLCPLHDDQ